MSPLMSNALDSLLARINKSTGMAHPSDLEAAVELFRALLDEGETVEQDEIVHYVEKRGVSLENGLNIQLVFEVLALARRPGIRAWKPDIIAILKERASKAN